MQVPIHRLKTYRTLVRAVFEVQTQAMDQQTASRLFNGILLRGASQVEVAELQHGLIINSLRSVGPIRCQHGTVDPAPTRKADNGFYVYD